MNKRSCQLHEVTEGPSLAGLRLSWDEREWICALTRASGWRAVRQQLSSLQVRNREQTRKPVKLIRPPRASAILRGELISRRITEKNLKDRCLEAWMM